MMTSMNISLTPEQQRFIEEKVASGRYHTSADVVREALRLLMEREDDKQHQREAWVQELRRKIEEGLDQADRGELLDADDVFSEIEKRIGRDRPAGPAA